MNEKYLIDYLSSINNNRSKNTVIAYKRDLKIFLDFLAKKNHMELKFVTPYVISSYLIDLKEKGVKEKSINRMIVSLRKFFEYLISVSLLTKNPMIQKKGLNDKRTDIVFLTPLQAKKIFEVAEEKFNLRDNAILELLYGSGLRVSETINLSPTNIDFRFGGTITVKGKHGRLLPLSYLSAKKLEIYLKSEERAKHRNKENAEVLFINSRGGILSRQSIWKICQKAGEDAGIKKIVTPQVFRDSFAIHLLQNGADTASVQELLGLSESVGMDGYLALIKNRTKEVYMNCHPRAREKE